MPGFIVSAGLMLIGLAILTDFYSFNNLNNELIGTISEATRLNVSWTNTINNNPLQSLYYGRVRQLEARKKFFDFLPPILLISGIVVSLIGGRFWYNSYKKRVKVEYFTFNLIDPDEGNDMYEGSQPQIDSEILLRVKYTTSLEKIYLSCNDYLFENPDIYMNSNKIKLPQPLNADSSNKIRIRFLISEDEYNRLKSSNKLHLCIHINHTFDKINFCKDL